MRFFTIVLLCCCYVSAKLPSYIKPCARSDPKFNACALQHANEHIKELVKGDRKNDIPVLDPLHMEKMEVNENGFHITSRDVITTGLKDAVVTKLGYDFKSNKYQISFRTPRLNLVGNYEVSGKILILPISGKGVVNCTLVDAVTDVNGTISFENKDGKNYLYIENSHSRTTPKRMYLKFTNLFNGNKLLETQMNEFLDVNWKDVYEELSKQGTEEIMEVILQIINKIYKIAPYEEMFPETL